MSLLSLIVLGCGTPAAQPPEPATEEALRAEQKTNPESSMSTFIDGPALSPSTELLEWLKSDGSDQLLKLPVEVSRSVLGVTGGTLGWGDDALQLKLDDTAMGVGLFDRLPQHCGDEGPCHVWLEGYWGETVPMPDLGPHSDSHPFSVRRLVGLVEGEPERIQVAGPEA